jgi:hypothetical protein
MIFNKINLILKPKNFNSLDFYSTFFPDRFSLRGFLDTSKFVGLNPINFEVHNFIQKVNDVFFEAVYNLP